MRILWSISFVLLIQITSSFLINKILPFTKVQRNALIGNDDASILVEVLNKRIKEGKLTDAETYTAIQASDSLLEHLSQESKYSQEELHSAVVEMDVASVNTMLSAGLQMNETTTTTAFWSVVQAVDNAEANDLPLSSSVSQMIHHIFDADQLHLLNRDKQTTNMTCMQPDDDIGVDGAARKMNYIFDDSAHKDLPLMEGRQCEGGTCCDQCSRNIFPTFCDEKEISLETFPELSSLTFNNLEKVSSATIIQFVRLVERVRRTIAHEYGLPLKIILPLQAYSRKYVAGATQTGGGGGEGDFVTLHTDEATHDGYHYSCVLYLSTQGVDFEGGEFVFNDPAKETVVYQDDDVLDDALMQAYLNGELPDIELEEESHQEELNPESLEDQIRNQGRELSPYHPTKGAAVIFSSGWENMHEVSKITSGVRYVVPCFFTTCPVPDAAYEQMHVGKPQSDEDIADDWLHLLLAHRKEEPVDSVGRVKELLMKWHYICTPLSEH